MRVLAGRVILLGRGIRRVVSFYGGVFLMGRFAGWGW